MRSDPTEMTAIQAAQAIREGRLRAVDLVRACLDRIAATDGEIGAWAHVDAEGALARAAEMDRLRQFGMPLGPLHGIPVGLKDIIDTKTMPTERGTPIFKGRQPDTDAFIVDRLLEAGAVILGKTVSTELAFLHPSATKNPHNPAHTPGGSSSGSAAAVAAGHVPLALGTQTNGSVIRPASFCGVYGFKPTRGLIARTGVLQTSKSLDQLGGFARSLEDAALLADAILGYAGSDPASLPRPGPAILDGARAEPPVEPDLAWLELPYSDRLSEAAASGLGELLDALPGRVERLPAPPGFADLIETQRIIHEYEICRHLAEVFDAHWDMVSDSLRPVIERARQISDADYERALEMMHGAEDFFANTFEDFDAILAPSALGEAPLIAAGGTGDPVCCTIWTVAGLPCLSLPLLVGETGLPIGVQLIGCPEKDDRLCRTAAWMLRRLQEEGDPK